jgi:tetratricopeptide (TPR) repeat protein
MNIPFLKRINSKKKITLFCILFFVFGCYKGIAQTSKDAVAIALKQFVKHAYTNKDSAVYYLQKAKLEAKENSDDLVAVYGRTSDYFTFTTTDLDSSLFYLDKAIKLRPKLKDTVLIAQIYNRKGYVFKIQWKFKEAFLYYNKAISILEKTEEYRLLYNSYVKIGKLYGTLGLYEEAFVYFEKSLQLAEKDTSVSKSFVYRSMGQAYKEKGDYEEAEICFEKAIEIIKKRNNSKKNQAEFIRNNTSLAALAYKKGNYKKALALALKSEKWIKKVKNKETIVGLHLLMGQIYYAVENDSLALHFTEKSYLKAVKMNVGQRKIEGAKQLSLIYQRQQKFDKAMLFLQRYNTMKAAYAQEEVVRELMKASYLATLKEKDEKLIIANENIETKKLHILLIISVCIGLLALAYVVYRQRIKNFLEQLQKSKAKNIQIKENLVVAKRKTVQTQNELNVYTRLLSQQKDSTNKTTFLQSTSIMQQLQQIKILTEDDWLVFKSLFINIHPDFYKNFKVNVDDYSLGDLKLASLIRLNFNTKEIAKILAISPESVRKGKYRLRKKMTFASEKELQKFIYTL